MLTKNTDRSIILLKPDMIERSLDEYLKERTREEGLKIIAFGQVLMDLDFVKRFYGWSMIYYAIELDDYLCRKPLIVRLIEGDGAIERLISIKKEMRARYCSGKLYNLFHCSDSKEDFEKEYKLIILRIGDMKTNNQVEVIVFTKKEGEIFFLLLKRNPKKGGFWQSITGNVRVDESFEEAATRELKEEIGIFNVLSFVDIGYSFEFFDDNRQQHEKVFGAEVDSESSVILSSEHTEFVWVKKDQALNHYLKYPGNKEGLKKLAEKIKEKEQKK